MRRWIETDPNRALKEALGTWVLETSCDPDVEVECVSVVAGERDACLTEVGAPGLVIGWRLVLPWNRIDLLSILNPAPQSRRGCAPRDA